MNAPAARRVTRVALAVLGAASICVALLLLLPRRVALEVGVHRVAFLRPRGFAVIEHDRRHLLRDGPVLVELVDLGAPGGDPDGEQPLQLWIDWAMSWLETSDQREVARSADHELQGREIRVVETWDSLTHAQRRRFAFVRNAGALLVVHTRSGDFERSSDAFDHVLRSLEFDDP